MKHLLTFSFDMLGTQLIAYLAKNVDSVAIGRVWGPAPLGIYDRAYQVLVVPLNQLNAPLSRVAIPVFSRLTGDTAAFHSAIRKAQLLTTYCTGTLFALFAALAPAAVDVLFGPEWVAVAPVLTVLAVGGIFRSLQQVCFWIYTSLGLTRAQLKFYLVAQPMLVLVILLGLPWGILGVAIGHSVGFGLYWAASMWWVGRVSGVDSAVLAQDAARALGLFAVPVAVSAFLAAHGVNSTPGQLVAGGLAALLVGGVLARTVRPIRDDLGTLTRFARMAAGRHGAQPAAPSKRARNPVQTARGNCQGGNHDEHEYC
jgi:PST family polysaccharide transporter